jgi:hypothetical protein
MNVSPLTTPGLTFCLGTMAAMALALAFQASMLPMARACRNSIVKVEWTCGDETIEAACQQNQQLVARPLHLILVDPLTLRTDHPVVLANCQSCDGPWRLKLFSPPGVPF